MKSNTIKKKLKAKIDSWLKPIRAENKKLAAQIAKNVIVTGGAITSMLLNEKINDYDIYFKDFETAFAVTEFYAKKNSTKDKLNVKSAPYVNINNETEKRIYITFTSFDDDETKQNSVNKCFTAYFSENAITLTNKIQIVHRFYGEPAKIHVNFDFVHCSCYYLYNEDYLCLPQLALKSILEKSLIYVGSLYPLASIFRVRKFLRRGWSITAGQMLKMVFQLNELNLNDVEVL